MAIVSYFDKLQRASFITPGLEEPIEFPVSSITIEGGIRDHVHEYPHAPGGRPELLGRKLRVIQLAGEFHNTLPAYPHLYPDALQDLIVLFEREEIGKLVVPTFGTIRSYCRNWTRVADGKHRSGERMSLTFVEHMDDDAFGAITLLSSEFNRLNTAFLPVITEFESTNASLVASGLEPLKGATVGLFDSLKNVVGKVQSIIDQKDVALAKATGYVAWVDNLLQRIDDQVEMKDPARSRLVESLRHLSATNAQLGRDIKSRNSVTRVYTVPLLMSVGDISKALYGDSSRISELIQINSIIDAFAVPAGTRIAYYPPT